MARRWAPACLPHWPLCHLVRRGRAAGILPADALLFDPGEHVCWSGGGKEKRRCWGSRLSSDEVGSARRGCEGEGCRCKLTAPTEGFRWSRCRSADIRGSCVVGSAGSTPLWLAVAFARRGSEIFCFDSASRNHLAASPSAPTPIVPVQRPRRSFSPCRNHAAPLPPSTR